MLCQYVVIGKEAIMQHHMLCNLSRDVDGLT